ncbi:alpha/beta fold hydrolase [Microtetraspora malaysiensis]|uniref:alpha/beta fold hydrolase n=1 Tax=Microtetraspora malaysiensis TaxID=161358 RepID=UPI003D949E6B
MIHGVSAPDLLGETELPDGRTLGWAQWGPPEGIPVLFFSGAAMGRGLGFGADALGRLGARLIAVDRPGLGASAPLPGRTLESWAADVAHLAERLELPEYGIVAFSQGAPFALACAEAGLPKAVAVVSGQDDLTHPAFADLLEPGLADLLRAVAADPEGFEKEFAREADAAMMWRLVVGTSSDVDLAVYTDPDFAAVYRASLEEGFRQGPTGYVRDLVLAFGRWPFDPSLITVPVDLWYGAHDASSVHSPDRGAELARRIPASRRHLLPEAGGSLLWTHAEEILASLLDAVRR